MYNTTIIGFTYTASNPINQNTPNLNPDFVDLVIYDRISDEIRVLKNSFNNVTGSLSLASYKTIAKESKVIEDLPNGVGAFMASTAASTSGYFDIYVAATV